MTNDSPAQFDAYSHDYADHVDKSVRFSGQKTEFFHQVKVNTLVSLLAQHQSPGEANVFDLGCGTGSLSELMAPRVKSIAGADVSADSVDRARLRVPKGQFWSYDGESLPMQSDTYELSFTSCVMHHVPPPMWASFVSEMVRITRPGGLVAVIEHNPWNPLTRLAVSTCEFDKDAVLLTRKKTKRLLKAAGLEIVAQPYILFFPLKGQVFRSIESGLQSLPMGAQYIVVGRKAQRADA